MLPCFPTLAVRRSILASIYPPLFGVLVLYAAGGTALSVRIGAPLVGLNFAQEAREADFRYALVRVRENAESVAFYGGERAERAALSARFAAAVANLKDLLLASRNLSAFTSGYRYLIGVLPAALVAPLYFRGEIEFGVINQARTPLLVCSPPPLASTLTLSGAAPPAPSSPRPRSATCLPTCPWWCTSWTGWPGSRPRCSGWPGSSGPSAPRPSRPPPCAWARCRRAPRRACCLLWTG